MPSNNRTKAPRFNDVEFVRYELDKAQKEDLKARVKKGFNPMDMLSELVEAGYRVSFKWDAYAGCPACFLNPPDDSPNKGKCLTGRGRLAENAFVEAFYKHSVVFDGVWPNSEAPKGYTAWDD